MIAASRCRCDLGFTLLEVLVALAVLAIGLGSVIKLATANAENLGVLRDRAVAAWVADNALNELLLTGVLPEAGSHQGRATMADRTWHWTIDVSETLDNDLRRLDVAVRAGNDDAVLAELAAFKGRTR